MSLPIQTILSEIDAMLVDKRISAQILHLREVKIRTACQPTQTVYWNREEEYLLIAASDYNQYLYYEGLENDYLFGCEVRGTEWVLLEANEQSTEFNMVREHLEEIAQKYDEHLDYQRSLKDEQQRLLVQLKQELKEKQEKDVLAAFGEECRVFWKNQAEDVQKAIADAALRLIEERANTELEPAEEV